MSELNRNISKFWEIETIPERHIFSAEENRCEQHFHATAQRDTSGRFVVSLPFKENVNSLGASYDQALKRFYSLEKRLNKNPPLKQEYGEFIKEYLELGHMRKAKPYNYSTEPHFYLPHHAVVKENSITTRLRVVFDGSAKTSSGVSLNDTLMVGPKLQQDLFDIVCRFRLYAYVITADVAKMYRQVRINEQCMPFQRILWRMSDKTDVEIFELTTVTYGTASASYLATKVLQQLAMAKQDAQPFGAEIILRDFYVDDLLTGAQTIDQANKIIAEVTEILSQGKLELRKWASNKPELLQNIPETCCGNTILDLDKSDNISTLGLQWNATMDTLQYALSDVPECKNITKRQILSHISKVFDPLGLLSPFTVRAKILMQDIWKLEINWDESLPLSIETTWLSYVEEMKDLNNITIPRHVFPMQQPEYFELHGFSDASEKAYGACVYVRALNKFGDISCNLLCAKSRIAPIKTMTLPRLELSGALLLARLMERLTRYLSLQFRKTCYWTDSSIVLSWLKSPKTFKTFVANRIAEIQELTNIADWHHIGTKENPADLLSRGTTSSTLMHTNLWWHGPKFLQCSTSNWPDSEFTLTENLPECKLVVLTNLVQTNSLMSIFERYSDLNKLIRVVAYCLRFTNNIRARIRKNTTDCELQYLTSQELNQAMMVLTKRVQVQTFRKEYQQLQNSQKIDSKSNLLCLNPFMDNHGIMRVGGRLKHSNIPYDQKHQILLPAKHHFTKLIIQHEHIKQLHAGTQSTIAAVRMKYWPLSLKNSVKSVIRSCVTCIKAKPICTDYLMGDLPQHRLTPGKAFENIGVDYFGPVHIRDSMKRKHNLIKAYGAVFVCFATKAVHVELVGNLSTEAFLAALKRFVARRGSISNIYSDNGTQFIGANTELKKLLKQLQTQTQTEQVKAYMAHNGLRWHFIPPRSPHFGGLWEAAVKSVKTHLTKIIGNASLNYEELSTLLVQIE
ncbi:hypothetical protein Trydic_g23054, partial [Trypoxylus dichotomus]